jgi:hypothetical protein
VAILHWRYLRREKLRARRKKPVVDPTIIEAAQA